MAICEREKVVVVFKDRRKRSIANSMDPEHFTFTREYSAETPITQGWLQLFREHHVFLLICKRST